VPSFHNFFDQLDNFRTHYFLWVTAGGLDSVSERSERSERVPEELEEGLGDEGENPEDGEG